jgi:uncharacterized protein (DUF885 family)
MDEAGFHDAAGGLFAAFCRVIRAARALADLGLHTEAWSRERVAAFFAEATGMSPWFCAAQGIRHARSGMQGLAYFVGRLGLDDLRGRARARLGARFDELAFQDRVLDAGPIPPALLAPEAW